jgi:hypothetical protein
MIGEASMTEHNTQSKSMLAKLLATENISFQHSPSAKTAYFDVKNRLLVLPVWRNISNDLYDMLVVHEVGHALDTKADDWLGTINKICKNVHGNENDRAKGAIKGFLNVIEDARIDKRQKRRYPGARRNYIVGYKELIERDFFGTATKDINSMSFIDRMNLYFKGGALLGVKFSKEEMPFIKRAENLETWAEVEALTEEVYLYSKRKGENNQELESDIDFGEGDDDSDDFDFEMSDDGDDFDFDDDDADDSDGNSQKVKTSKAKETSAEGDEESDNDDGDGADGHQGEGDINETDSENQKNKTGSDRAGSSDKDFIPESQTERAWERNLANIVADDDINYVYVDIPKANHDVIVHDYKRVLSEIETSIKSHYNYTEGWYAAVNENVNRFKAEENATISFMVKEFEARKSADIYSRISVAKTGVIDTNKLHSYKFNEDIFRRLSVVPNGKNHGFIMFLDWSGSMSYGMTNTVKQLMSLTMFCKRVQIPFEVYTFRDPTYKDDLRGELCFDRTPGTFSVGNLRMRNILSSRMNVAELNRAYVYLWARSMWNHIDPMNGTPLNQAIIAAEKLVNDFRKNNKLQIVNTIFLTDGESNPIEGVNSLQYQPHKPKGTRFILRDNVAKKEYNINGDIRGAYGELTNILLRILKDRTDTNLIGFFLSTDSTRSVMRRYFNLEIHDKMNKFWKENKFVPVKSEGYDEYYVINAKSMAATENKLTIDPTMTKTKIAKEFMKFTENKSINRVLLRQFIDKVSSNKAKAA